MKQLARGLVPCAVMLAAVHFLTRSSMAQLTTFVPLDGGPIEYLYTAVDIGGGTFNAVDPTRDSNFVDLGGDVAIWAFPGYDIGTPVNGRLVNGNTPRTLEWATGNQPAEYGGVNGLQGLVNTVLTQPASGQRYTQYFRYPFTSEDEFSNVILDILVDDGAVVYLDGSELYRINCCGGSSPGQVPDYRHFANGSHSETNITRQVFELRTPLPAGDHVLGVEVHQHSATSSDTGLNIGLATAENQWSVNHGGDWRDPANWVLSVPNGVTAEAKLLGVPDHPVTVFSNNTITVKSLEIDNPNNYNLAGPGGLLFRTITGNASLDVISGDHQIQIQVALSTDTDITVTEGSIEFNNDVLSNQNRNLSTTGNVTFNNRVDLGTGMVTAAAGAVSGNGTVNGDFVNDAAMVAPGDGIGTMTILGDYLQGPDGTLSIEVSRDDYDVMVVAGDLRVEGGLEIELMGSFVPDIGDVFEIIKANRINGRFDAIGLPNLSAGLTWDLSNLYAAGSIAVVPEPGSLMLAVLGMMFMGATAMRRRG